MIRRFLDQAYSGELGHGIIGCDSWAWAFVSQVWHGWLPIALTLQAFDRQRLINYIHSLTDLSTGEPVSFRQSDKGQYVLPSPNQEDVSNETSNFLQLLAAYSRGIFGIAWEGWLASLKTEPQEEVAEQAESEDQTIPSRTVWVTPWDQLELPTLPNRAGLDEAFVLHTMLLHNGLAFEQLEQLLPLSPNQGKETLLRLKDGGLVAKHDHVWQVSPLGYPAVRRYLKEIGYLVDSF